MNIIPAFIRRRIAHRPNLLKITDNIGWLFFDKILRMGVGLFVGVWVARYLGPERFGQFNFAVAFVALFSAIATLGLDGIVVRELVRHPEKKNEILGSAFGLKIVGGLLALLVVFTAIVLLRPLETQTQWLVGIIAAGMIFQAFDVADLWFQSQVQSKFTVIAKNVAFVIMAAVKIWLILTKADLLAFALAATVETALGALGLIIVFQSVGNSWINVRLVFARMKLLLRESFPLLLSSIAVMFYVRIDQIMLAEMVGEYELGQYSAALRLSEVWYVIPTIMVSSVMPSLTEARQKSKKLYYERLEQLFVYLARIAYLVAVPMTILANSLVILIYGEAYIKAGLILGVHIWASVFVFMGVARGIYTVNEGLNNVVMYGTLFGAFFNVLLNFLFIPIFGALGAAISTTISYGASDILFYRFMPSCSIVYKMMIGALTFGVIKNDLYE